MKAQPEQTSNLLRFPAPVPELSTVEAAQYVGVAPGVPVPADDGGGGRLPPLPARREESEGTARLRREIDADLAALGVCYRGRIFRLFELEEIAAAYVEVMDARRAGGVRNAAGLFIRVLEGNTGRPVFG